MSQHRIDRSGDRSMHALRALYHYMGQVADADAVIVQRVTPCISPFEDRDPEEDRKVVGIVVAELSARGFKVREDAHLPGMIHVKRTSNRDELTMLQHSVDRLSPLVERYARIAGAVERIEAILTKEEPK